LRLGRNCCKFIAEKDLFQLFFKNRIVMEDRLVTLATDHYTAAEVLKVKLEGAGIACFLKHVHLIQGAAAEGVQVQIRASQVEKALRLMAEWKAEQEESEKKNLRAIRRILVPVDFSTYSENACLYALNLAHRLEAEIKILHVYYAPIVDLVPITDAYSIQVDMDINLREMESIARQNLLTFVERIGNAAREKGFGRVKIGYSLREGVAEDQIAQVARSYKPGIIVLGTKGKGNQHSDIIGSVVSRLLDRTRVPVLAIPENSVYTATPEVRNVVYATEFDESDFVAIRRLMGIVSGFNIRIHCVHVSKVAQKTWDLAKMDGLKEYFKKVHPEVNVDCHLLHGEDPVNDLAEFTREHKVDLIALTNRKRNLIARLFFPGMARQLLHQGSIPLLVFRT
jgi:nucleotide-binding universal stress UspA family protein